MIRPYVIIVLLLCCSVVTAHPPDKINLDFNQNNNTFKVVSEHPTKDVAKHYISRITVKQNDKIIVEQFIPEQENEKNQTVMFYLPYLKPGDKIRVISQCNVFGKKEIDFIIPQPEEKE